MKASGLSTRDHILAVARALFAAEGYEATSTEKVLQKSGVSRGALYHHFKNKEALFEAVLEALEEEMAGLAVAAAAAAPDPLAALRAGCAAFLLKATEPEVRQIVLVDAHSVVGWQKWRDIEARYGLGLIKQGLAGLAATYPIEPSAIDLYAHILLAALIEVAFVNSRAANPAEAARASMHSIDFLLQGMLAPPRERVTP